MKRTICFNPFSRLVGIFDIFLKESKSISKTSCYLQASNRNPNQVGTPPYWLILKEEYRASIYILSLRSDILWDTHSFLRAVSIWALWKVWNIWDFCKIKCILSPASCSKTSLDPWTNGWKEKIFFSTSG